MLYRPEVETLLLYNRSAGSDQIRIGRYGMSVQHIEGVLIDENPHLCYYVTEAGELTLVLNPQWLEAAMSFEPPALDSPAAAPPESLPDIITSEPDEETSPFRPGQLDYDIPDVMMLNKPTICIIRIGDMDVKNITISSTSLHASIDISDEMSVKLIDIADGDNFRLTPLTTERQGIEKGEYTEWKISVRPLQEGTFPLVLCVSAHFDGRTKDTKVLEKSVMVSANPSQAARDSRKKIVFIAAGSKSGLLLGKESNEIWEELLMAPFRDDFLYVKFFEVTNIQFNRALAYEKPSIVHFSGHGSVEGIFLANERGEPQLASNEALIGLFKSLIDIDRLQIECILLNACFSRPLAEGLVKTVPVVIGTNAKIGDEAAIKFSEFFYRSLGGRKPYEDAYESGCKQIKFRDEDRDREDLLVLLKQ